MRSSNWVTTAMCATLVCTATGARSSNITIHTAETAASKAAADLIDRTARALTAYLAACAARDGQNLSRTTTDDVRIEYVLNEPGVSIVIDANSLLANCTGAFASISQAPVADLWIFPTVDAEAVFIHYDAAEGSTVGHRQLALVEMRGDRISRMVNYAGAPESLVAKVVDGAESHSRSLTQASQTPPLQRARK